MRNVSLQESQGKKQMGGGKFEYEFGIGFVALRRYGSPSAAPTISIAAQAVPVRSRRFAQHEYTLAVRIVSMVWIAVRTRVRFKIAARYGRLWHYKHQSFQRRL